MSGSGQNLPTVESLEHKLKGMENCYEELVRSNKAYKESTDNNLKTLGESLVKIYSRATREDEPIT